MVSPGNIADRAASRARKIAVLARPKVVGAVHTVAGLRLAQRIGPTDLDVVEIRVDALETDLLAIERTLARIQIPVLITARHPAEGGIGGLSAARRKELIMRFLPYAAFVDVELRSASAFEELIEEVKASGATLVISDHHFRRSPTIAEMLQRQRHAFRVGADVFKLAALLPGARELGRMLSFAAERSSGARALMGMGKFGQVSRLALAQAGSVLNYGYLDVPNAPGQWEARQLKRLLARLGVAA
jgi:3-dehydroquinate dehydratase I